jgi:hypothetical protein
MADINGIGGPPSPAPSSTNAPQATTAPAAVSTEAPSTAAGPGPHLPLNLTLPPAWLQPGASASPTKDGFSFGPFPLGASDAKWRPPELGWLSSPPPTGPSFGTFELSHGIRLEASKARITWQLSEKSQLVVHPARHGLTVDFHW